MQRPSSYSYDLVLGDTLFIDLKATSNLAPNILMLDSVLRIDTNNWGLPLGAIFSMPQLSTLNANGRFYQGDSSLIRFSWIPQADNYLYGPDRFSFRLEFKSDICGAVPRGLILNVLLRRPPTISSNGLSADSLKNCGSLPKNLEVHYAYADSLFWSPGTWVVDSTQRITQTVPGNDGWLYIVNSSRQKLDSIYIQSSAASGQGQLSQGGNRVVLNHGGAVAFQNWTISNAIKVNSPKTDTLEFLGAGTYSVYTDPGPKLCQFGSDTLNIPQGNLWASNLSVNRLNKRTSDVLEIVNGAADQEFAQAFTMPGDARIMEELFIYGFKNIDPSEPLPLRIQISTNQGYRDSLDTLITSEEYLKIPANFIIDSNTVAQVRVSTPEGLELQMLQSTDTALSLNYMRYSQFKRWSADIFGNVRRQNTDLRFPLGIKYQGTVSLLEGAPREEISLYPVPSDGKLQLYSAKSLAITSYQIRSINGQVLQNGQLSGQRHSWELGQLKAGIYFLSLEDGRRFKFVLQ